MSVKRRNLSWSLTLLFLAGVVGNKWKVKHENLKCAVRGSSVVLSCSFKPPDTQRVKKIRWGRGEALRFISESNSRNVSSRFQFIGDERGNCSLKIHRVERSDAGTYAVKFFTHARRSLHSKRRRTTLKVVDLRISSSNTRDNATTKEGDSVSLTCVNDCDDSNSSSAYVWLKNGEVFAEGSVLYLRNVSASDRGNYTCSLKSEPGSSSGGVKVDVEHGPKNTSACTLEVHPGGLFTLICSSRANPPADNHTWFLRDQDNGDAVVGRQPVFSSQRGGLYFCSAANKHGSQNSSAVSVKVKDYWVTLTRDVVLISTAVVFLIVASVIAIRRRCRRRLRAQKPECEEEAQDTDYVNWLRCERIQSNGRNEQEEGTAVVYAAVHFQQTKSSTEHQSCDEDEPVIYSTVCRQQLLKPSYIEPS